MAPSDIPAHRRPVIIGDANGKPSELDQRDHVAQLLHYLQTLLASANENFETATVYLPAQSSGKLAASNGFSALAMAGEYLEELASIEKRPVAREHGEPALA